MDCCYWLLVTFALCFALPAKGHEACYEDSWAYHDRTYTCFKLFQIALTWPEARDNCSQVQLGSRYGVTTRLAKIDDGQTNEFVRTLFPRITWICWIGLYYNTDKKAFRWDGYPDETPIYIVTNWNRQDKPYVSIDMNGWRGRDNDSVYHFVCQHSARKIANIICEHEVQSHGLKVTCTSRDSPIEAKCRWTHKYNGQSTFPAWQSIDNPSHENNTQNTGGDISFTTACWTTLSNLNPGNLTVKMQMYPDIPGMDLSTTPEAVTEVSININIEIPNQPQFKMQDKIVQTSSPIHFNENDTIYLSCEIQSGKPTVHSVTMSCEFPFTDSDADNNRTVSGTEYVMNEIASRDMNGKNCTCIGHHLTGPSMSSPLTFNITYPTEVKYFTVNGQTSLVAADVNERLILSCLADGNPLLYINIQKLETTDVITSNLEWRDSGARIDQVLNAQCDHNGRYRCSAYNMEGVEVGMQEIDIRVRCLPSYCHETSRDLKFAVIPGGSQSIVLCVVAYPLTDFVMLKNSKSGWVTSPEFDDQVTRVTSFNSQQIVTLNLPLLGPSHLGEYALVYSVGNGGATSSLLYFQLTAPFTACNPEVKEDHKVIVGQTVIISICATAFPSPSNLVMQKAKNSEWQDYINANSTTLLDVDFNTLINVKIIFLEAEELDMGDYRLFDPQKSNRSASSYLKFSLSKAQLKDQVSSSSLSTGTVVGLILASNFVVVILTILSMIAFRKLRKRNKQKSSQARGDGHINTVFHTPEEETPDSGYVDVLQPASDSGYVDVAQHASFPEKTSPPSPLFNTVSDTVSM